VTAPGATRWVVAVSGQAPPRVRGARPGESLLLGREGDVAVGVDVDDPGVSRRAAVVTATGDGWDLRVTNRNGAVLHPWGQAAVLARPREVLGWPLVGLRIRGADDALDHWVLLEAVDVPVAAAGALHRGRGPTTAAARPAAPLTGAQLAAVRSVFAEFLAWPPVRSPQAAPLRRTARALGISEAGVKDRLQHARRRAVALGLSGPDSVVDPGYVHVLVRAGLLPLPPPCSTAVCRAAPAAGVIGRTTP
jgi:hypothetical protein